MKVNHKFVFKKQVSTDKSMIQLLSIEIKDLINSVGNEWYQWKFFRIIITFNIFSQQFSQKLICEEINANSLQITESYTRHRLNDRYINDNSVQSMITQSLGEVKKSHSFVLCNNSLIHWIDKKHVFNNKKVKRLENIVYSSERTKISEIIIFFPKIVLIVY